MKFNPNTKKKRVLCVDDDAITLMLSTATIKQASFSEDIVTVTNGQEAMEYYESLLQINIAKKKIDYPHIIFLDINMPILSGWEFLDEFIKQYYEQFNETKVVILSSTVDPRDRQKASEYPIVIDFYSKPITKQMLSDIAKKLD